MSAITAILIFFFDFSQKNNVFQWLYNMGIISDNYESTMKAIETKAAEINISNMNEQDLLKIDELADLRDHYTGISIYDIQGRLLSGYYAPKQASDENYVFSESQMEADSIKSKVISFKDQKARVVIYSYHMTMMTLPYFLVCLLISIFVFLVPIFIFVNGRVKYTNQIKDDILVMAQGDLQQQVRVEGNDELAILAQQIDYLRIVLDNNIRQEAASRKANQELITALSHDIRTPLTTLLGYLEIIRLKKCSEEQYQMYINHCISKVMEIRDMSNQMFDYSLVYDVQEEVELELVTIEDITLQLKECVTYLELREFHVITDFESSDKSIYGNPAMFKRMVGNLASNLAKYADISKDIHFTLKVDEKEIMISIENTIIKEQENVESTKIGTKTIKKSVEIHNGTYEIIQGDGIYRSIIKIPIASKEDKGIMEIA